MWLSRARPSKNVPLLRNAFVALALVGATSLAGCTGLTPVYGERGLGTERQALQYADPQNRLDQIIYQELVLRFGRTADPARPTVRVSTSFFTRQLNRSLVNPPFGRSSYQREATVSALVELLGSDGSVILSTRRSAAALYTTDSQALAESEAEREALERAARELAETVRLTLLGALTQAAT